MRVSAAPAPRCCRHTCARAIVPKPYFLRNFNLFTLGPLRHIDWSNVFAAGGSVLACLTTGDDAEELFSGPLAASDVDLFLYGFGTESDGRRRTGTVYC